MTSRIRIHRAAMELADELSSLAEIRGYDYSHPDVTRHIASLALSRIAFFLRVLDSERGKRENLDAPIGPLMLAILDFETTQKTPKIFEGKTTGRPGDAYTIVRVKMLCVMLLKLYVRAGLQRKEASKRLSSLIARRIKSNLFKSPKPRTLESWFDKCQKHGDWHSDYEAEFGKLFDLCADSLLSDSQTIDAFAADTICQLLDLS